MQAIVSSAGLPLYSKLKWGMTIASNFMGGFTPVQNAQKR